MSIRSKLVTGLYILRKEGKRLFTKRSTVPLDQQLYFKFRGTPSYKYLYTFFTLLQSQGYKVYLIPSFSFYRRLNVYGKDLLADVSYRLAFSIPKKVCLLTDYTTAQSIQIDYDYLTTVSESDPTTFTFPLLMHPYIYQKGLASSWSRQDNDQSIKILFCGNCSHEYDTEYSQKYFGVPNRHQTLNAINAVQQTTTPLNSTLPKILSDEHNVLLVDSKRNELSTEAYLQLLCASRFFLALPGYGAPTCHNVYEAIFTQSIPLVHRNLLPYYGGLLKDHVNCLVYTNLTHLNHLITQIIADRFRNQEEQWRANLRQTYSEFLSPEKIIASFTEQKKTIRTLSMFYDLQSLRLFGER